jgi:hypothetical protein
MLGVVACTAVPAPVYGPGMVRGVGGGANWAVTWSRAHARVADSSGREWSISSNGANAWGDPDGWVTGVQVPIPAAYSLHLAHERWDGGGYAGWRRCGLFGRVRALSFARATTSVNLASNIHWRGQAYDATAGLEQTFSLGGRWQLLLRANVGAGRRNLAIQLPQEKAFDPSAGEDNRFGPVPYLDLLRDDLRAEPVIGLDWGGHLTLSVQPYRVLAHGQPRYLGCHGCTEGTRLLEFSEASGFTVALAFVAFQ